MNDSKFALSNLTKSRWLRLSASVGLAFGLAVVMLLLPLAAGTSVTLTVPALTQLSSPLNSVGNANWSLGSTSIEVGLPFGVQSVSAVGGITVTKTANITTAYQGGLVSPSTFQPGEIVYTIIATNNTGSTINPPFYISDTIPTGTACDITDNNGNVNWTHNQASCDAVGVAQFNMVSGTWPNGTSVALKFYVSPNASSVALQSQVTDDGVYTVTNSTLKLHNPGGSFGGGIVQNETGVNVQTAVKAPVWDITKTAPTTVTSDGGPVTYSINIANTGAYSINPNVLNKAPFANSSVVTITEWLPTGVMSGTPTATDLSALNKGYTTISGTKVTWVITDPKFYLDPGATYATPFTVAYTTVPTLPAGYEIVNSQYKVEGGDNVYYPDWGANVTTTVQGPGYLTVTKYSNIGNWNNVVPGGVYAVGDKITYTIKFTYGSFINSVMITDMLPTVTDTGYTDFINYTLANNPSGLLVNYLGGALVSCTGGTTGTVTAGASPVGTLWIKTTTGTTGTACTATIPTQMRSFMPNGVNVFNRFSVSPVVANVNTDPAVTVGNNTADGVYNDGNYSFHVENYVTSDNTTYVTKSVFPTVIDPNSSNANITYSLIITQGESAVTGNGWDEVQLYDDLFVNGSPTTGITWAVYLQTKPSLITVSKDTPAPLTYTNGQLVWDEQNRGLVPAVTRIITGGTNLNDRFFQLKAKVITKTPTYNNGVFCNENVDISVFNGTQSGDPTNTQACVTVVSPQISVTKMADWAGAPSAVLPGGQVVYTFTVTNTGNVTVSNLVLTDAFASGSLHTPMVLTNASPSSLAPGAVATATLTYTVIAGDVDTTLNAIYNSVTATALAAIPGLAVPPSAIAITGPYTVPVFIANTISMTKIAITSALALRQAAGITLPTYGDMITYTYILTNNSTNPFIISSLVDDKLSTIVGPVPQQTIPGLSSATYTATSILNDALISGAIAQAAPALSPIVLTNTASFLGTFNTTGTPQFSGTVTATVEITYTADVMMAKTADVTQTAVGGNVNYTLFITNTGSVTLGLPAGVVSDSLWGDTGWLLNNSPVARPASALSPLAPGASTTIQYTLPITQGLAYYASLTGTTSSMLTNTADITLTTMASSQTLTDFITSTVSATAQVTDTDSFTVAMVYTPSITLTKSVTPISATIGTVLNYNINVTNNGNVDLTNITVTDYIVYSDTATMTPMTVTVPVTTLAAGASTSYNYTVTVDTNMAPFNFGAPYTFDSGALITNTAMVTGDFNLDPAYGIVKTVTATNWNTITTSISKDLQVTKTATWSSFPAPAKPGDVVTYSYTVLNKGTLAVTATLFDDRCQFLDTGSSLGCISTALDLDALVEGQVISSGNSFTWTATSNVDDELIAAALRQTPSSLTLINTAWAEGTLPGGVVESNPVTASVPFTYTEDVQFSKSAVVIHNGQVITTAEASVGDTISYTLVITNNGNIGYQDVSMTDITVLGQGAPSACADYVFAPQRAILEGYVITPSTVFTLPTCAVTVDSTMMAYIKFYGQPASTLVNTATVMVTPSLLVRAPAATNILGVTTKWATASVVLTSPTQLLLTKVPSVMTATVGDTITYTYYITNQGSVDFSIFNNPAGNAGVTLWDDKLGTIPTGINDLAAGASAMVEAAHVVTYSDYNINSVVSGTLWLTNSAVATGYVAPAFGTSVPSVPATAKVALDYTVDVSVVKTSDKDSATVLSLGEPIVYTLTLVNNGNIPVTVTLSDVYNDKAASQSTDLPASVWLGANGAMTNVVYHDAVLPAYLDASILTQTLRNVVTATANDGLGNLNQLVSGNVYTDTDDEILTAVYDLNVVIAKSTTTPMVYFDAATKTVTYQYVLTNTGKTTQTASLVDWFQGYPSSLMTVATVITLPPNVPVTTTASFSITDAYLDNGIGPNQAVLTNTARAYVASGSLTVPFDSNPVTVTVVYTPSLSVLKSANLAQARVGDTITYTILVANNGLVTLRNIIFEDRLLGVRNLTSLNMSPGGVPAQFVVSKTITLVDLNNLDLLKIGAITNTANVTGSRAAFDYGFDSNTVTVKIVSGASLTMTKIGSATSVQVPAMVTYTYMVTNNGTVDISNISLTDNKLTLAVAPFTLTKDAAMVVTASTMLTQPNVAVTNIATANATFGGIPVVATATWTINTTSGATCTVSVNAVTPVLVGQASAMTATLSPVGSGTFAWTFGDNSTGTGVNVSHVYTAAGTYTATVAATHANGATCQATTQIVVNKLSTDLAFAKSANPASGSTVATGSTIVYNLTVTNTTANVVNGVVISDTLPTGVTFKEADHAVSQNGNGLSFTIGDLLANDVETVVVTVTVNAASGTLVNSAFATNGTGDSTAPSTVSHIVSTVAPNLQIAKTSERPKVLQVGTLITYTIRVTNTGNADATQVVITDTLPAGVTLVGTPTTVPSTLEVGIVSKTVVVTAPSVTANGGTASVNIVVRVNDSAVGLTQLINTAFVSSLQTPVANSSGPKVDPADTADSTVKIAKPKLNVFLPIIIRQPDTTTPTPTATAVTPTATPVTPQPGLPNLQSKIKLPASVAAGQAVEIEVVVTNVGGSAITDGFWVDFYINPNDPAGLLTRGGRWDSDENNSTLPTKQGIAWEVKKADLPGGSLAPGASITLVSRPVGDAGLNGRKGFDPAQTTWSGSFVKGTSTLVSYADSYAGSGKPAYLVVESSETDNANRFDFASALGGVVEPDFSAAPFHPAR